MKSSFITSTSSALAIEGKTLARRGVPLLATLALFLLPACGNSGADDPLTGSWDNNVCFGSTTTPAGIDRCTTNLTFTADLGIELRAEWFAQPATATNPRCTTTRRVTGQTWSTDSSTFTVTGTGTSTIERTSCINESDNLAATPTSDISIPGGGTRYEITNGTLTILSGDLAGTYDK